MSVAYTPGSELGRTDLNIFLFDETDTPFNAFSVTYAIYYYDEETEEETLIGGVGRTPVNAAVGEYYAALLVPSSATIGEYRIRWAVQQTATSAAQEVVMRFQVVEEGIVTDAASFSDFEAAMIAKLRILLRDNNPDRNYRFRPPEHEGTVGQYNRVFGYIWEDDELLEYLERSVDWWNMFPPETEELNSIDRLCKYKPVWRTAILWNAITHACFALAANMTADEFDYSIGGVSLSIEKSGKYESLKANAEGQFDKATEAKARTVKIMRGLKQPKYGIGIRSAFGPHVAKGVLSPRKFI